jgi:hypothetical protein
VFVSGLGELAAAALNARRRRRRPGDGPSPGAVDAS